MKIILSTAYLAPVSYYCKLMSYSEVLIEQHEHYLKQTYRNRCIIAAPGGTQVLTIPIVRNDSSHSEIRDIEISDHSNWAHQHWQAILTAYENSPYFEYYVDDIYPFYEKSWKYLLDFNETLREKISELIDIQTQINLTDHYLQSNEGDDYRNIISPKSVTVDQIFNPAPYYQVFEQKYGFIPNLSIVDLLFNMGPEALLVLNESVPKNGSVEN